MKVILKGGPYDGEVRDVPTIGNYFERPVPFFKVAPPLSPAKLVGESIDSAEVMQALVYELKEVWIDGRLNHYEYHYQGH